MIENEDPLRDPRVVGDPDIRDYIREWVSIEISARNGTLKLPTDQPTPVHEDALEGSDKKSGT